MASGIELSNKSDLLIEGLIQAQLDFQLIEYYKLLVQSSVLSKNFDKANSALKELLRLILMDNSAEAKEKTVEQLFEEMDNWKVAIDLRSVSLPEDKLILKSEAEKFNKIRNL